MLRWDDAALRHTPLLPTEAQTSALPGISEHITLTKALGLLYKLLTVANQNECQGYFSLKWTLKAPGED